jgi:hypothetical protein
MQSMLVDGIEVVSLGVPIAKEHPHPRNNPACVNVIA